MLLFPLGASIEHNDGTSGIIQEQSTLYREETCAKLTKVYLVTRFLLRMMMIYILQNLVVMLLGVLVG